jgi:hypothetical protein
MGFWLVMKFAAEGLWFGGVFDRLIYAIECTTKSTTRLVRYSCFVRGIR